MDIHGIVFGEQPFYEVDDLTLVEGADITAMAGSALYVGSLEKPVGIVTDCRKVLGARDARSDADRGLLDLNQGKPFVRATARLLDTERGRQAAQAAREKLLIWYSMGYIIERSDGVITASRLKGVLGSCHAARTPYRVFPGVG